MRGLQRWTSGCEGSGRPSRTSGQAVNKTCTCDNCAALRRKRREHRMRAMRRRTGASLADPVMYADGSVPTVMQTSFCAFTRCPFLQASLPVGAALVCKRDLCATHPLPVPRLTSCMRILGATRRCVTPPSKCVRAGPARTRRSQWQLGCSTASTKTARMREDASTHANAHVPNPSHLVTNRRR